jgi:hypothetical protein
VSFERRARIWAALAGLGFIANRSDAHLKFPEFTAERAVELHLEERPIRIDYRLSFGPALAADERRKADRDRDGRLSSIEEKERLDQRTRELGAGLRVCLGRSLDELECRPLAPSQIERIEASGWRAEGPGDFHVAWTLRLDRSAADIGALRFEDAFEVEGVAITDVRITPPEGRPLLLAADARSPSGVAKEFTWIEKTRPPGPRVVLVAWAPPAALSRPALFAALAVAGAGLFLFFRWRRRR